MTNLKDALQAELGLVNQLVTALDRRSGRGILYIPEQLQTEESFIEELSTALTTPIVGDPSFLPFIIKGPADTGADTTGDAAFLYVLFDRQKRLQERITVLEELDKAPDSLV